MINKQYLVNFIKNKLDLFNCVSLLQNKDLYSSFIEEIYTYIINTLDVILKNSVIIFDKQYDYMFIIVLDDKVVPIYATGHIAEQNDNYVPVINYEDSLIKRLNLQISAKINDVIQEFNEEDPLYQRWYIYNQVRSLLTLTVIDNQENIIGYLVAYNKEPNKFDEKDELILLNIKNNLEYVFIDLISNIKQILINKEKDIIISDTQKTNTFLEKYIYYFLNNTSESVLVVDENKNIIEINQSARQILNLYGITNGLPADFENAINNAILFKEPWCATSTIQNKQKTYQYNILVVPLKDENQEIKLYIVFCKKI